MKRNILSLFVAFCVLVAPIAHAAGLDCMDSKCHAVEQTKKSDADKKDDGKLAKTGHQCCCAHVSAKMDMEKADYTPSTAKQVIVMKDDTLASVVLGPPLEPPSHA